MIGEKLRLARHERELSLQEVAAKAKISAATLSRIENGKQAVDVEMVVLISRILKVNPADLFDSESRDGVDPLASRLATLDSKSRARVWTELAANTRKQAARKKSVRDVSMKVEELLAQIDFMRAEIEAVRKRMR